MKVLLTFLCILPMMAYAQCDLDNHNTSKSSGWISCETAQNPNSSRGNGHWIMYDFTWEYMLEQMHVWNHNHPESLNDGIRDIVIDISLDGVNWTQTATMMVPQASGTSSYTGVDGPMLNTRARYVLITALNNYGGNCMAMSELRIGVADEIDCLNYDDLAGDLGHKKYYADDYINTNGIVKSNNIVHFQAHEEVNMTEGFVAEDDTELLITIKPCNN